MTLHDVSLADRFDLSKRTVLLGGIQALVRVLLMQKARDEAAGLRPPATPPATAARRSAATTSSFSPPESTSNSTTSSSSRA